MALKRMKRRIVRAISFFTACIFLVSQITFANPGVGIEIAANREVPGFLRIDIPSELASLDGIWEAPPSSDSRVVLHIQNAHANYGAQKKIQSLLEYLNKTYAIKTIFVEGAAEDLNPDYLKLFPDKAQNLELADLLAQQGELTGAELYLLEADYGPQTTDPRQKRDSMLQAPVSRLQSGPVRVVGIEDAGLYRQNYEALKKVFGAEALVNRYLKGYESRLEALSSKIFTNDLRRVLSDWQKFEKGHREFMPYIRSLAAEAKRVLKLDLESLFSQVEWPQITRLLVLQGMEKELDTAKALEEKDKLINFLKAKGVSSRIIAEVENFKEQRLSVRQGQGDMMEPRDVLEALSTEAGPKGFRFSDYPAFSLYAGYLVLKSELDAKGLFEEIKVLFEKILDSLAASSDQKALLGLYRDEELARKLLRLELSRRDWKDALGRKTEIQMDSMVSRLKDLSIAVTKEMNLAPADLETKKLSPKFQGQILDLYGSAFSFYEFARQREAMFYAKINSVMGEGSSGKAVLITGGFHTDGMTDLFREHNISYGVLTPRLMEKSDEKLYQNTMLQNEKQLFSISYLELASGATSLATRKDQGFEPAKELGDLIKAFRSKLPKESATGQGVADAFNNSVAANAFGITLEFQAEASKASEIDTYKIIGIQRFEGVDVPVARSEARMIDANKMIVEANALLQKLPELSKGDLRGGMEVPVARSEMRGGLIAVVLLFTGMMFYFGLQIAQSGMAAVDASKDQAFLVEAQSGILQGLPDALGVQGDPSPEVLSLVAGIRTDWVKLRRAEHLSTDTPTFLPVLRGWLRSGADVPPPVQGKVQDLSMKILLSGARSEVRLIGDPLGIAAAYYSLAYSEASGPEKREQITALRKKILDDLTAEMGDATERLNAANRALMPLREFLNVLEGDPSPDEGALLKSFPDRAAAALDIIFGKELTNQRMAADEKIKGAVSRDVLKKWGSDIVAKLAGELQKAAKRLPAASKGIQELSVLKSPKGNDLAAETTYLLAVLNKAKTSMPLIFKYNDTDLKSELSRKLEEIVSAGGEEAPDAQKYLSVIQAGPQEPEANAALPALQLCMRYEKARQVDSRSEARNVDIDAARGIAGRIVDVLLSTRGLPWLNDLPAALENKAAFRASVAASVEGLAYGAMNSRRPMTEPEVQALTQGTLLNVLPYLRSGELTVPAAIDDAASAYRSEARDVTLQLGQTTPLPDVDYSLRIDQIDAPGKSVKIQFPDMKGQVDPDGYSWIDVRGYEDKDGNRISVEAIQDGKAKIRIMKTPQSVLVETKDAVSLFPGQTTPLTSTYSLRVEQISSSGKSVKIQFPDMKGQVDPEGYSWIDVRGYEDKDGNRISVEAIRGGAAQIRVFPIRSEVRETKTVEETAGQLAGVAAITNPVALDILYRTHFSDVKLADADKVMSVELKIALVVHGILALNRSNPAEAARQMTVLANALGAEAMQAVLKAIPENHALPVTDASVKSEIVLYVTNASYKQHLAVAKVMTALNAGLTYIFVGDSEATVKKVEDESNEWVKAMTLKPGLRIPNLAERLISSTEKQFNKAKAPALQARKGVIIAVADVDRGFFQSTDFGVLAMRAPVAKLEYAGSEQTNPAAHTGLVKFSREVAKTGKTMSALTGDLLANILEKLPEFEKYDPNSRRIAITDNSLKSVVARIWQEFQAVAQVAMAA